MTTYIGTPTACLVLFQTCTGRHGEHPSRANSLVHLNAIQTKAAASREQKEVGDWGAQWSVFVCDLCIRVTTGTTEQEPRFRKALDRAGSVLRKGLPEFAAKIPCRLRIADIRPPLGGSAGSPVSHQCGT